MASDERPRPFKVWDGQRTVRKSLVASSLAELKTKGAGKLGYGTALVTAVLEEDGTEIDDNDYFSCLDDNTVILLLKDGEHWHHPTKHGGTDGRSVESSRQMHFDQADGESLDQEDGEGTTHTKLPEILKAIKGDTAKIITLSTEEMLVLCEANSKAVANGLGVDEREATNIQLSCQRYLDDRSKALDAISLLKMCTDEVQGGSSTKRKKTS